MKNKYRIVKTEYNNAWNIEKNDKVVATCNTRKEARDIIASFVRVDEIQDGE
jgi:hypothetical protein